MQTPEWLKPAVWGAVAGAIAITIVGFSADWVVSAGEAQEQAELEADKAVVSALTPVCVAQFKTASAAQQEKHVAALQGETSWERGEYVEEHGWATVPGAERPNDEVADACAEQLLKATTS